LSIDIKIRVATGLTQTSFLLFEVLLRDVAGIGWDASQTLCGGVSVREAKHPFGCRSGLHFIACLVAVPQEMKLFVTKFVMW
jgi:hypothetical protein